MLRGIAVLRAAVGDELLGGVVAEQLLYLSVDLIARDSGVDLGVFKPLVLAEGHVVGKVIIGIGQLEVARCFSCSCRKRSAPLCRAALSRKARRI